MSSSWDCVPLRDLCDFHNGLWTGKNGPFETATVIRNTNFTPDGRIDLSDVAILQVEARHLAKRRLRKGDIIIEKSGGGPKQPVGRVVLFELDAENYSFSNFTSVIRVKNPRTLDPSYLHRVLYWWYVSGLTEPLQRRSTGIRNLDFDTYKNLDLPVPPIEEQKRIVAKLDQAFAALDRARDYAEANLSDAEDLLSSFMEEQLEASGGHPMTLQELMDDGAITGHLDGNHGSEYPRKEEFVSDGVPYISANCIVDQQIDFGRAKYLSVERAARIRKGLAKDQDVIFAHNATVGPVALLSTKFEQVVLGTSVTYYRCNPQKILPEFLMYEMRGAGFRAQYEAVMEQATRNQVPITMQRTFTHCIPSIEAQRDIVDRCKDVDAVSRKLVERYSADLADITALRQALLHAAFSGPLT